MGKNFIKLNAISALYAFVFFISIELWLNFYRICRLTGLDGNSLNNMILALHIFGVIMCSFLFFILIKKWLEGKLMIYWSTILWFPYFILFTIVFAILFPITNQGDIPTPGTGFLLIGELIVYPLYLLFINFFGTTLGNNLEG
jgi:hypothetical protein